MFVTYPERCIPYAREALGEMYEYALSRWNFSLDEFQKLFIESGVAQGFAAGAPDLICPVSGASVANFVLMESNMPQRTLDCDYISHTPSAYVAGSAALYQRKSGRSFEELHVSLPMSKISELLEGKSELSDYEIITILTYELCKIEDPECRELIECDRKMQENPKLIYQIPLCDV